MSPGSDELLPSVSISFSSSNGTPAIDECNLPQELREFEFDQVPSVLTMEEVSKEAKDPASARQDGV